MIVDSKPEWLSGDSEITVSEKNLKRAELTLERMKLIVFKCNSTLDMQDCQ